MSNDERSSDRFTFFGTDVQSIPCFKQSFTYGLLGGVATGLGHFLFTSRVKRSGDFALATFTVVTLGTWFYCRYKWSESRNEAKKLQEALKRSLRRSDRGEDMPPPLQDA